MPSTINVISSYHLELLCRLISKNIELNCSLLSTFNAVDDALFYSDATADIALILLDVNELPAYQSHQYELEDHLSFKHSIDTYLDQLETLKTRYKIVLFFNWDDYFRYRGQGTANYRAHGSSLKLDTVRLMTAQRFMNDDQFIVLDLRPLKEKHGNYGLDEKLFYHTKSPFSLPFLKDISLFTHEALQCLKGSRKKLLILDLDNTLWGGVIGDDGSEGIKLGGHHSSGEAYQDFQKTIKTLKESGILLAICSKNYEETALQTISHHSEMVLKTDDFIIHKINWQEKSVNIESILKTLNLSPDSVVFLDDSVYERNAVKSFFPEITVPTLPKEPFYFSKLLKELSEFDQWLTTEEDTKRTQMYQADIKRKRLHSIHMNKAIWLNSLDITVKLELYSNQNKLRVLQLLNKTNQFNLNGSRFSPLDLEILARTNTIHAVSCSDKFGDYGLIAVVIYQHSFNDTITISHFAMSCRVMAKDIEHAILNAIIMHNQHKLPKHINMKFLQTTKNRPFKEFLEFYSFDTQIQSEKQEDPESPYNILQDIETIRKKIPETINSIKCES